MIRDIEHSSIKKPNGDNRDHLGNLFQDHKRLLNSESIIQLEVTRNVSVKWSTKSSTPPSGIRKENSRSSRQPSSLDSKSGEIAKVRFARSQTRRDLECLHEMIHDVEHSFIRKLNGNHRDHLGNSCWRPKALAQERIDHSTRRNRVKNQTRSKIALGSSLVSPFLSWSSRQSKVKAIDTHCWLHTQRNGIQKSQVVKSASSPKI